MKTRPAPAPKHRFFVPSTVLSGGERIDLPGDVSYQVRTVLRLRPGARVVLLDGTGLEYVVELVALQGDQATGRVLESRPATGEPRVLLTLYAALLKGQHLEWVLQKGTELGVSAFVPMVTQRTVVRDVGRVRKKTARWENILREAAEQCRRGRVPRLSDPLSFADACHAAASDHDRAFLPCVQERGMGLADAVRAVSCPSDAAPGERFALLIGPEGGFDEAEVQLALDRGIQAVTLGPRTLRAETAALAAATILMGELGELGGQGTR